MDNLFMALLLLSMAGLLVGLIRPTWVKLDSRKRVGKVLGSSILVFFILFGITNDSDSSKELATTQNTPAVQATTNPPAQPATLEDQITQAVNNSLGAKNNSGKPRVVSVKIDTYNSVELTDYGYKPTDTVKGVLITINASENLTTKLQKGTIQNEASKALQAIFPLSPQIGDVVVWSQLPLQDKYGNSKDGTAVTFAMSRTVFGKINWPLFDYHTLPDLLNSETRTDDRNGSHELIRFQ